MKGVIGMNVWMYVRRKLYSNMIYRNELQGNRLSFSFSVAFFATLNKGFSIIGEKE
jgi:hypothetical protein